MNQFKYWIEIKPDYRSGSRAFVNMASVQTNPEYYLKSIVDTNRTKPVIKSEIAHQYNVSDDRPRQVQRDHSKEHKEIRQSDVLHGYQCQEH